MKLYSLLLIAPLIACAADDPYAANLFKTNCASCHASAAQAGARIPQMDVLKTLSPVTILRTLETGVMKAQAAKLSTNERQALANYLGSTTITERRREELANPCPAGPAWKNGPNWSSWAPGLNNTRFQSAADAGLTAADVPKLTPKWVFAFPDTSVLRSQPAVYRGRIFAGAQDGTVYALDAATGCVHWSTTVHAEVRSGLTVAEVAGQAHAVLRRFLRLHLRARRRNRKASVEAATRSAPRVQSHRDAGLLSRQTLRRRLLARRSAGGCAGLRLLHLPRQRVRRRRRHRKGAVEALHDRRRSQAPRQEPSAARPSPDPPASGVWNAATLDPDRDTLYIGTGDNYSDPVTPLSDAIVALRMSTGEILWSKQFTEGRLEQLLLPGRQSQLPRFRRPGFRFRRLAHSASRCPTASAR